MATVNSPRLHILQLPWDSSRPFLYPRHLDFRKTMYLDEGNEGAPSRSEAMQTAEWSGLQYGDLLFFPDKLTGAGEFEACRFVGSKTEKGWKLLNAGIESPTFPAELLEAVGKDRLRDLYESLIVEVLNLQRLSLQGFFGGDEIVDQFWAEPDVNRNTNSGDESDNDVFRVPLSECTWLQTIANDDVLYGY